MTGRPGGYALNAPIQTPPPRGRGARSNLSGRFETTSREAFDDGWSGGDETPPRLARIVLRDTSRSIITANNSPAITFDPSINPSMPNSKHTSLPGTQTVGLPQSVPSSPDMQFSRSYRTRWRSAPVRVSQRMTPSSLRMEHDSRHQPWANSPSPSPPGSCA